MFAFLLAAALIRNLVLMTGVGFSVMLRVVRRPRQMVPFGIMLLVFTLATTLIAHPLNRLFAFASVANYFRPLMIVAIVAALYIAAVWLLRRLAPRLYAQYGKLIPLAAFNNLVVLVALLVNAQFQTTLLVTVGLSIGANIGFLLLCWLTSEGMERLDNPDMPAAFRGLPATLLYLGILAMAIMGFSSGVIKTNWF